MSIDSQITLAGTIVTLLGMAVTIWQAAQARTYKNQIKFDIRKINLSSAIDRLKRTQDEIRKLPTSAANIQRGIKPNDLILNIKAHFDFALGVLDAKGPDGDIRSLLSEAQSKLNSYEASWNQGAPNAQDVHDLQSRVQDAVSQTHSRIFQLEGKA
ncbi:MAG: hypothetical protein L0287_12530 [Anaerolineae bacterium]|nr:hypothetical protein [Anaerolineae bacterium]